MALRLVTEKEAPVDPVEELKEVIEVLDRASSNPLLSCLAGDAVDSTSRMLRAFLPLPGLGPT